MTFLDPYKRYALLLYATSKVAQHKKDKERSKEESLKRNYRLD